VKTKNVLRVSTPRGRAGNPAPDATGDADSVRARILLAAREKFLAFGFSRVTMDEISTGLGISKATLYKHFKSKKEILDEIVDSIMAEIFRGTQSIIADGALRFPDKVARLFWFMGKWFSSIGTVLMQDVQRNEPEVWDRIEHFRKEKILVNFRALLEEGVREGLVVPGLDLDLIMSMYLSLVQEYVNPGRLTNPRRSLLSIVETVFRLFFEGILTGRAREDLAESRAAFSSINKEVFP
jgi:AcrR family transcriptional regulator